MHKPSSVRGIRPVLASIRDQFAPQKSPKRNITIENHPDLYYKHVYLTKKHYDAVEFLAKANGSTIKQVVHDMLETGIARYMEERIVESNRIMREQRERGVPVRPPPFVRRLRKLARDK